MSVPNFTDLGKNAREVFKTGYHYGKSLIKLNFKTMTGGNFEMGSTLALDCDALKVRIEKFLIFVRNCECLLVLFSYE